MVHDGGHTPYLSRCGGGPLPEQVWCMMEVPPLTRACVVHDEGLTRACVVHDGGLTRACVVHDGGLAGMVHDGGPTPYLSRCGA